MAVLVCGCVSRDCGEIAESWPIELYMGIMGIIPGVWDGSEGNDWCVSEDDDELPETKI